MSLKELRPKNVEGEQHNRLDSSQLNAESKLFSEVLGLRNLVVHAAFFDPKLKLRPEIFWWHALLESTSVLFVYDMFNNLSASFARCT